MKKTFELTRGTSIYADPTLNFGEKPFLCLEKAEEFFPIVKIKLNLLLTISDKRFPGARSVMVIKQRINFIQYYNRESRGNRNLYSSLAREVTPFFEGQYGEKRMYFKIEAAPEK